MSNTFGKLFRVTSFGESHGSAIGAIIDGCPAGIRIERNTIQMQLDRRRPGQSQITTTRQETDQVEILSGVDQNISIGTPITLMVTNKDMRPKDYNTIKKILKLDPDS